MPRPACRGVVISAIVVSAAIPLLAVQARTSDRALAAIFAHPDDEIPPGPMLARYAREGVDVPPRPGDEWGSRDGSQQDSGW